MHGRELAVLGLVGAYIEQLARLVTHHVDEGLAVASHAFVMLSGRIVRRDVVALLDRRTYGDEYRAMVVAGDARTPMSVSA